MRRALSLVPFFASVACSSSSSSGPAAPATPPGPTCSIDRPALDDWHLHADGTRFRDSLGRVVVLRGVDAGGRSKLAPYVPFDFADGGFDTALASYFDRANSWGIDAMRVPFVWAAVEPTQGTDDEAFLERYDAILDAAWAHGIWTVVDFHQDVYAEILCGDGFPAWTLPDPKPKPLGDCPQWPLEYTKNADVVAAFDRFWADGSTVQAAYVSLWDRLVARYRDRPGVLGFEPINEPSSGSANSDQWEATTLTEFHSRMVMRMRAAAPNSLVFVDPSGLSGLAATTKLQKPAGDGIVFAPHFYPFGADMVPMGFSQWAQVGTDWDVPVFVGEFGCSHARPDAVDFITAHYDALDALGLSGTQWEYSVSTGSWNEESDSLVAADGTEYPVTSALVRPFARAIAGDSITSAFDAASRTFTLSFTPSGRAPSEVSVPSRLYPEGLDVTIAGACADATHDGVLLVQAAEGSSKVELRVAPKR